MQNRTLLHFLIPLLFAICSLAFIFLPALFMLIISFLSPDELTFVKMPLTLINYKKVFSTIYLHAFLYSLFTAALATFICLVIGYPCAYIISCAPKKQRSLLLLLLIIPFWTSSLVRTYALVALIKANGIINNGLIWIGIIKTPLEILYTQTAVMAGLVYTLLPFMILPLYSVLDKLDKKYIEAACDLGAGKITLFLRIIIPLSMPGIMAGCILVFLPALSLFYITDLLGGARDLLLGNIIKNQFLITRNWPFGAALCVTFTMMIVMIIRLCFKKTQNMPKEFSL